MKKGNGLQWYTSLYSSSYFIILSSVDLSILIGDISIDSDRPFSLTCRATIVARPFKFEPSDIFA